MNSRLPEPLLALALAAALMASAVGTPAFAGAGDGGDGSSGSGTGNGFQAVAIHFSGEAAPGGQGGSTIRVRVQASCWWRTADGPYTDPVAYLDYYDNVMSSGAPWYARAAYGDRAQYERAAAAAAEGDELHWYSAYCKDQDDYVDYTGRPVTINGTTLAVTYRAFAVGAGGVNLPPPQVEPESLAEAAREVMVLPLPEVSRNPETTTAGLAGATFVNLPTWFWVDDPAAVGGGDGQRAIRAEVAGGAVWAEVVATTQGLRVSSPAGATTCPPAVATRRWSTGADDADGCTVAFERASVAYPSGYPVTTSTTWEATWTGSGGTGGTLAPLAREAVTQVPVAESQAVITAGA